MNTIELNLSFHTDGPLYMQLYKHIRALIQEGVLKDGTKLPSIRSLGRQLNISKTTIETAYHLLLEEGYVLSKERAGLIVVNPYVERASIQTDSLTPRKLATELEANGQAYKEEGYIDFSLLTIDGDSFPLRIWKSIVGESLTLHSQSLHEYAIQRGNIHYERAWHSIFDTHGELYVHPNKL